MVSEALQGFKWGLRDVQSDFGDVPGVSGMFLEVSSEFQGVSEAFQVYSRGFKGTPGDFSGVPWVSGVF